MQDKKQKVLIYGGTGLIGSRILELLSNDFEFIAPTHEEVDLSNFEAVSENIATSKPDQIVYAAGFTNVDLAEDEKDKVFLLNAEVVRVISESANNLKIPLHYLSTDYVFDGTKTDSPYTESDAPNPLSVYAKSKREGELVALGTSPKNSVLRLIMPYSATYKKKPDLVRTFLSKLRSGESFQVVSNQNINPIFVDDFVFGAAEILKRHAFGIYHLAATTYTTPFEFVKLIAKEFGFDYPRVSEANFEDFSKIRKAQRPQHSWLSTDKFRKEIHKGVLHSLEEGIQIFKGQLEKGV